MIGLLGKITASPGRRDDLVSCLLRAADLMRQSSGCLQYVVHTDSSDDGIWVSETWTTKEAHGASLSLPGVRELIQEARPLIAGMDEQIWTTVVGGKGMPDASG